MGSALGTALIGTVLAIGLAQSLPAHLKTVEGLPAASAEQLSQATQLSAGGTIAQIRAEGDSGKLGAEGPAVADALADGLADASKVALYSATVFLALGFLFALMLRAKSRKGSPEA